MKKNELRITKYFLGYTVGIWSLKSFRYREWLIAGSSGETKLKAFWSLIKYLYRYGNMKELFHIRSVKFES